MKQHAPKRSPLFPILMKLEGERTVVIGGGSIAERKVASLLACGAEVTVVSPRLKGGFADMGNHPRFHHIERTYQEGDLDGAVLAVVAINNKDAGEAIARDAKRHNVPVNVVDRPELCTFIVPAVVRRGHLTLAVSTGGASPAWSGHLKQRLAEEFGEEYTRLFDALSAVRHTCMGRIADPELRREIFLKLADDAFLERARSQSTESLEAWLLEQVTRWTDEHRSNRG